MYPYMCMIVQVMYKFDFAETSKATNNPHTSANIEVGDVM